MHVEACDDCIGLWTERRVSFCQAAIDKTLTGCASWSRIVGSVNSGELFRAVLQSIKLMWTLYGSRGLESRVGVAGEEGVLYNNGAMERCAPDRDAL